MNAQELADYFEYELKDVFPYCILTIRMLREQADRIAELEKQGKPVAWMDKNDKTVINLEQKWADDIPLYTTPQTKPLSDEEILQFRDEVPYSYSKDLLDFARAIEERHGIK